jgi:hypothetical protein
VRPSQSFFEQSNNPKVGAVIPGELASCVNGCQEPRKGGGKR